MKDFEYFTCEASRHQAGKVSVHGWRPYPSSSVLSGQMAKCYIDTFDTLEEAQEAYPEAGPSHVLLQPQVSLGHLPDSGDLY